MINVCLFISLYQIILFFFSLSLVRLFQSCNQRYFFSFFFPLLTLCSLLTLFHFFMSFGSSGFVIKVCSLLHNNLISCFFCKVFIFLFRSCISLLTFCFLHFVPH